MGIRPIVAIDARGRSFLPLSLCLWVIRGPANNHPRCP